MTKQGSVFGRDSEEMEALLRDLEQQLGGKKSSGGERARTRRKLEAFLGRMPEELHATSLRLVSSIGATGPVQAESVLKWLPDLIRTLPRERGRDGMGQAIRIARASAAASYGFLTRLLHLSSALGAEDFVSWVDEGLRLLERNESAGRAYFELHSRTAREGLKQGDHAVYLDEIRDALRLYVHGVSGKGLDVQSTGPILASSPAEMPWVFPYSDGQTVLLPPAVQSFATYEENRLFYRILAAHQAGYYEYDSFGFGLFSHLERLARHPRLFSWKPDLSRPEGTGSFLSDLQVFFHLFPHPGLAQRIFTRVEDGRVHAQLKVDFPGLKADMGPFVEDILAGRPSLERLPWGAALLEMLLQSCLDPERPLASGPAPLRAIHSALAERLAGAFRPGASVGDAAVAATEIYWFFHGLATMRFALANRGSEVEDGLTDPEELSGLEAASMEDLGQEFEISLEEIESLGEFDSFPAFHGTTDLGNVQRGLQMAEHLENAAGDDSLSAQRIMSLEELKKLLERGLEITVAAAGREMLPGPGLFFQNPPQEFSLFPPLQRKEDAHKVPTQQLLALLRREHRNAFRDAGAEVFYYDEWDHTIGDYRAEWCKLLEREVCPDDGGFVAEVRATYGPLIPSVRRQFEKLRPEEYRQEKSLLDGEEIDLDRVVEHLVDRRCGLPGTNRVYQERRKVQRDVCTVFLVDMSSSTSEPVGLPVSETDGGGSDRRKRIIDIEKEALILMAEALESIGDRYGIYGFSGCGRLQVDFHTIKDLSQRYSGRVRGRIGAIEPGGSTRMGTALRHCRAKLSREAARRKNLFLISDGFPQDQDYGFDRTSHEYGVQDTARALAELAADGTYTYCVTVDRSGEDYLRKMCPESQYMVINDILSLPQALLKIYRQVTTQIRSA